MQKVQSINSHFWKVGRPITKSRFSISHFWKVGWTDYKKYNLWILVSEKLVGQIAKVDWCFLKKWPTYLNSENTWSIFIYFSEMISVHHLCPKLHKSRFTIYHFWKVGWSVSKSTFIVSHFWKVGWSDCKSTKYKFSFLKSWIDRLQKVHLLFLIPEKLVGQFTKVNRCFLKK